ncbi:hypothetical protein RHOER0001_3024 [Rhodococcus erythropolis SK121]|nr:hypothetical protein RHOER0001_3024 [Rhodococcus erythropolis SK121]
MRTDSRHVSILPGCAVQQAAGELIVRAGTDTSKTPLAS